MAKKSFTPGQGYTQQDWDDVGDNPEWTKEDFANARPFAEVFPDLADSIRKKREVEQALTERRINKVK